jgi:acyl transferase domain-containing protein/NAD(P)-dependent dehydrogenase (short-subunit alcohol dehydrogenase family)
MLHDRFTPGPGRQGAVRPIAIVGMACRFPGAPDPGALWRLLCAGEHSLREVPPDRWRAADFTDPNRRAPGKMVTSRGGFLDEDAVAGFDPEFFGISAREAVQIDPQQRLALELAWEALEHAGVPPDSLRGGDAGVFMGAMWTDYEKLHEIADIEQHSGTGWHLAIVPGRISHALELRGPSLTVDTACSSSLVAVHLACAALRERECSIAMAGGVSLMLAPHVGVAMSKFGGTSASGRCHAYDARADGYVRGEGGGVVVLRRYEDALAAGDRILALIHGSAVNNDGPSDSLTTPSEAAQRQLLIDAYARAGVDPHAVGFVEGHGTGTAVGDPIEARAIGSVLGIGRSEPLWLGSIKPNIGHTEAASGVASLIKATLALAHQQIPPNLEFEQPNPGIEWQRLRLRVPTRLEPFPTPAFVGVNSFGFGGTNCHVVLGQAPDQPARAEAHPDPEAPRLLVMSASTSVALDARIEQLRERALTGNVTLDDLAHTLWHRRAHLEHRAAVIASSLAELVEACSAPGPVIRARCDRRARTAPKLAFAFSGQGSQWPAMGHDLLAFQPFRAALARVSEILAPQLGWSPLSAISAGTLAARLEHVDDIQPAIYAIQVALADTWRSLGVSPDAVVGHSMGEVAAAVAAGAIAIEDGARITCARAGLLRRIAGRGGMLSLALGARELERVLAGSPSYAGLSLAVDAGANSSVVSGDLVALARLRQELEARTIECREVAVDVAAHSPQIDALSDELHAKIADIRSRPTSVRMISSVTGAEVDAAALTPEYWVRNLREHVQFASAALRLFDAGYSSFVEVGPHPLLTWPLAQIAKARGHGEGQHVFVASMRRGRRDRAQLLEAAAWLHCRGHAIELPRQGELAQAGELVELANYPWQRRRFWPAHRDFVTQAQKTAGSALSDALELVARFEPTRVVELAGHAVDGHTVVAAGVVIELGLRALTLHEPSLRCVSIEQLEFLAPLSGHAGVLLELGEGQISLRPTDVNLRSIIGRVRVSSAEQHRFEPPDSELGNPLRRHVCAEQHYRTLEALGVDYQPSLRAVASVELELGSAIVRVQPQQTRAALLDAAFQAVLAALGTQPQRGSFVAKRIERATLDAAKLARTREIHARITSGRGETLTASAWLIDENGAVVGTLVGIELATLRREASVLRRQCWRTLDVARLAVNTEQPGTIVVFGQHERASNAVAAALADSRVVVRRCERLEPNDDHLDPIVIAFAGAATEPPGPLEDTCEACTRLIDAIRACAQTHARTGRAAPVIVVDERARAVVDGEPVSLGGSALVGLVRVAAAEHPELELRVIDVGDLDDPEQRRELARELQRRDAAAPFPWLALRSDDEGRCRSLVPMLEPEPVPSADWRARTGTVIVSGGLGGIGRAVVRWLVERGVERVVVLGRRPLDDDGLAFLDSVGGPTRLRHLAVDVAELDELRLALADELDHTIGVIHSAAVLSDASLLEHDGERLRAALRPKLIGAWNLHELTRSLALEFFVLFGSVGGWIGLPGQASYAAANAALDGLAEHRRGLGLAATSIGWCGWNGLGFARTPGGAASLERLAADGIGSLAPDDALALLDHLLAAKVAPAIAVMPPVGSPGEIRKEEQARAERQRQLRSLAPVKRRAEILDRVLVEVAVVLRDDPQRIDASRPLRELGLDSLMSVELGERLAKTLGVASSTTLIWQHPSVDALVDHFVEVFAPEVEPAPEILTVADELAAQVDALSEDDVEALMRAL